MQRGGTTEGWSQVAEGLECQVHLQMRKPRPREIWLSFCPFLSYILKLHLLISSQLLTTRKTNVLTNKS